MPFINALISKKEGAFYIDVFHINVRQDVFISPVKSDQQSSKNPDIVVKNLLPILNRLCLLFSRHIHKGATEDIERGSSHGARARGMLAYAAVIAHKAVTAHTVSVIYAISNKSELAITYTAVKNC